MDKLFTKERRKKRQAFYFSRKWREIRKKQLEKAPFCEHCLEMRPKRLVLATFCDHTRGWETLKEAVVGPFSSLCRIHHDIKTWEVDIPRELKRQRTKMEVRDV